MKALISRLSILLTVLFSINAITASAQVIRTVAGIHDSLGHKNDDSAAIHAPIGEPAGVAFDHAGNLYIVDYYNSVVRKVNTKGIITTVAGTGYAGYNGDSILATTAQLSSPYGIAVDATGNLYIADNANFRVRKVDTAGYITTVAGRGGAYGFGYTGDGGPATNARLYALDVAVDQYQNIYIADGNGAVRKVTYATGIITSIAGTGSYGYTGDNGAATSASLYNPSGVAVDPAGNVYIADYTNNVIRMVNTAALPVITTIAGTGTAGFSGDGGAPISARLNAPYSVSLDDSGNLYIVDQGNDRIRKITNPTLPTAVITTVAGNGTTGYTGDGSTATAARLAAPSHTCQDAFGSVFIADGSNTVVREVSKTTTVNIIAYPGSNICTGDTATFNAIVTNPVLGEHYQWKYNGANVGVDTSFYINGSLATGDKISCTVVFPASANVIANSDTITIGVYPITIPAVSISNDTNNICAGLPVIFTATSVNGGSSPSYQWQVNGVVAYTGSSSYTYDPANGDIVNCILTSDAICAHPDTAISDAIHMDINADVIMNIIIASSWTDTFYNGEMATFVAQPTNEGSSPKFQWFINGIPVSGATSRIFNTDNLHNGDTVTCALTGSLLCTLPLTDTSAPIIIGISEGVSQLYKGAEAFTLFPDPNHGTFTIKGSSDDINIEVVDLTGRTVYSSKAVSQNGVITKQLTLNASLPAGIYMLRTTSATQRTVTPFLLEK